jgi:hypothetical protein
MKVVRTICLVAAIALGAPARADDLVIVAGQDTSIYEDQVSNSNGGGMTLFSGQTSGIVGPTALRRALLLFDVAGGIPAGATINSVMVQLRQDRPGQGETQARTFTLHRLLASWGEGTAGTGTIVGGEGFPTAPDGTSATWSHRFFNTIPWTTPGGDFNALASGTLLAPNAFGVTITSASTPGLVNDVQSWLDNPANNFGWALLGEEMESTTTVRRFFSREATDPAFRPQILVNFTPAGGGVAIPEPSTLMLLGLGALGLLAYARRGFGKGRPREER